MSAKASAERNLREHLKTLTDTVMGALLAVDSIGQRRDMPNDLGRELAGIANALEMANDRARYFGLGVNFRTDRKRSSAATAPGEG